MNKKYYNSKGETIKPQKSFIDEEYMKICSQLNKEQLRFFSLGACFYSSLMSATEKKRGENISAYHAKELNAVKKSLNDLGLTSYINES